MPDPLHRLLVSGATKTIREIDSPHIGRLIVPGARNRPEALQVEAGTWAMDNAAFLAFDAERFVAMLARFRREPGCLFVAVPDVVGKAEETRRRFDQWSPVVRAYGYPVALVAQDGLTVQTTPWDEVDAIFIGGTTEFKLGPGARTIAAYAAARGKHVHMGRVNTKDRLHYALDIGCTTIDGSGFSKWPAVNLPLALRWLEEWCIARRSTFVPQRGSLQVVPRTRKPRPPSPPRSDWWQGTARWPSW